jgi:hypothetical protein
MKEIPILFNATVEPSSPPATPLEGTVEHPVEAKLGEKARLPYKSLVQLALENPNLQEYLVQIERQLAEAQEVGSNWKSTLCLAGCVKDATVPCGWSNNRAEEAEAELAIAHDCPTCDGMLTDHSGCTKTKYDHGSSSTPQDAAKWISVEEKNPKQDQDILYVVQGTAHSKPTVVRGMRCYDISSGWWWCDEEGISDDYGNDGLESFVIWWMPTPTASLNLEQPTESSSAPQDAGTAETNEFPRTAREWLNDALGRYQVTHVHSSIRAALKAMDVTEAAPLNTSEQPKGDS